MQDKLLKSSQKIVILGTGGTIAGTAALPSDNTGYKAAQLGVDELVSGLPDLAGQDGLVVEQVAQLDSKDMDFAVWCNLAGRVAHFLAQEDVQAIVITHGTDTIEETAFFLHTLLRPSKPVVLTCAMRPATSRLPDGPQNLMDAFAIATHAGARGVSVVCAGVIHGAVDVQKSHTYRLDAFDSGDNGPIGYVEDGHVRLVRDWPPATSLQSPGAMEALMDGAGWPRVEIVMNYAGAGAAIVKALVLDGVQGFVVAGTGNGTLHRTLEAALLEAQAGGIAVVRATRCSRGRVLETPGDVLPDSQGLSPVKARIAMMLKLMVQVSETQKHIGK